MPDDDREGLKVEATTKAEIERLEAQNIERASSFLFSNGWTLENTLDHYWQMELHGHMFCDVWEWAGTPRITPPNIGWCASHDIRVQLRQNSENTKARLSSNEDLALVLARFHHKLVWIHPFRNGNGRWSRLLTECLAAAVSHTLHYERVLEDIGKPAYIAALRQADDRNYSDLTAIFKAMLSRP